MKKKEYKTPEVQIVSLKMQGMLMGSYVVNKTEAEGMSSGSFDARKSSSIWDDEVEE